MIYLLRLNLNINGTKYLSGRIPPYSHKLNEELEPCNVAFGLGHSR
jgi:hypothetical protein